MPEIHELLSTGVSGTAARARLSGATTVVGVMGDPVAHSLSPLLQNAAFEEMGLDWVSVGFRVPPGSAEDALAGARALSLRGLSVTMPHKHAVYALLDTLTPIARRLEAVNCVSIDESGSRGDNTDGPGLVAALRRGHDFDPAGRRCLVLGAGGAARSVVAALADAGAAEVVVVNRTPEPRERLHCWPVRSAGSVNRATHERVSWWSMQPRSGWEPTPTAQVVQEPSHSTPACSERARWSSTSSTTRESLRGSTRPVLEARRCPTG